MLWTEASNSHDAQEEAGIRENVREFSRLRFEVVVGIRLFNLNLLQDKSIVITPLICKTRKNNCIFAPNITFHLNPCIFWNGTYSTCFIDECDATTSCGFARHRRRDGSYGNARECDLFFGSYLVCTFQNELCHYATKICCHSILQQGTLSLKARKNKKTPFV